MEGLLDEIARLVENECLVEELWRHDAGLSESCTPMGGTRPEGNRTGHQCYVVHHPQAADAVSRPNSSVLDSS